MIKLPESFYNHEKMILALSGGIDSMVLADMMMRAKADFVIAHCNFHLRGEESDGDERFVTEFAEKNSIAIYVKHFDTEQYAAEQGVSIEMAARELRYAWFEELRQQLDYDYIAVAHHADDQLETFFINLLRGAGIRGLKGMQKLNGRIIRPLLERSRAEIHQYAQEHHLEWREDHTNAETLYLRNKIRHELLPVIDHISKEGRNSILKSINHLDSENDLYRELVKEKLFQIVKQVNESPYLEYKNLPQSNWRFQLLFEWLREYGFNEDQIHFIHEAAGRQPGKSFFSPTHRLTIERDGLELSPLTQSVDVAPRLSYQKIVNEGPFVIDKAPDVAQLDFDKLTFPLSLRRWQEGDRFHPIGMKGSRLISDFLKDLKLTTRQKENVHVLLSADNTIIWVVGYRIDDRFKVTDCTKTVFKIHLV